MKKVNFDSGSYLLVFVFFLIIAVGIVLLVFNS